MSVEDGTKLSKSGAGAFVYFHKDFFLDSKFPFDINEKLIAFIDGNSIVIKKIEAKKSSSNKSTIKYPTDTWRD